MVYLYPSIVRRNCTGSFGIELVIFCDLCRQRGVELLEGHLMPDHIHMCLSVPPKYSIGFVIGFLKGKSTVLIQCAVLGKRNVSMKMRHLHQ